MSYGKNLAQAAVGIIVITILSKILGFGREIVIAGHLGTTSAGDAFKVATFLPMMLFGIIATALTTTFIPLLTELEIKAGQMAVNRYIANVTNSITLLMITMAALGMFLNPWIVKGIAPGFNPATYKLTVELTYWLMPVIILLGFIGLTTGYLNFRHVFSLPRIGGFVFNGLFITLTIILVPRMGVYGAVAGLITAYGGQVLFLLIVAWRFGYRPAFILDWRDPYLLRMLTLAIPMLIGSVSGIPAKMVNRIFASSLAEGSIAALDYAARVNEFALGIFVAAIGSVYFPTLSRAGAARDWAGYRDHLLKAVSYIIYIIIPVGVGLMILGQPLIRLLFERGTFDERATAMTAAALFYYNIGLLGTALQDIFSQAFYALQDTVTPIINGVIMVLINVVLTCLLVQVMGLGGITLATSIAASIMVFYLARRLQSRVSGLAYLPIRAALLKGGAAVLLMAIGVKGCDVLWASVLTGTWGLFLRVAMDVVLGGILYFAALWFLKVPELREMISWAKIKLAFISKKPVDH